MVCEWCKNDMHESAIVCSSCNKTRRDIYENKIKTYVFLILGGLSVGWGLCDENIYLLGGGIVLSMVGCVFMQKVSNALNTWWWF